jgi:hypothetical protein
MRRYTLYLAIGLITFGIGSMVVFKFYLQTDTDKNLTANYAKKVNKWIEEIELENAGFSELINAKNGDLITIQGSIDVKFLCLGVTDLQPNVCTTVLIGSSSEKKSLLIRLQTCNETNKSSCIVWKPDNLCADDILCSDKIKIYDNNSKPTELVEYWQDVKGYFHKNVQLKITGKVSIIDGKARFLTPIQNIELIENR